MGTRADLWTLLHKPHSIATGLGCDEASPLGLEAPRVVQLSADLFLLAPQPIVPTKVLRAASPAVAARRSVVELVAGPGELRITFLGFSALEFAIAQATAIQANESDVTGGGSSLLTFTGRVLIGDRGGNLGSGFPVGSFSGAGSIVRSVFPPIPPGWRLILCGNADNTAATVDMIVEDRAGNLSRVEGA